MTVNTNVKEFQVFHHLLTMGRPDYTPFYFVLKPSSKQPLPERGSWKEAKVTYEEACAWMRNGYNIAIAGTDRDPLVIIDVDVEGAITDIKATLSVRTRKRTGRHYFYFTSDPRCKVNVPTAEHLGEVRSNWQYVVVTGSYVRTDVSKLETPPPETQMNLLGMYTIEDDTPVATIIFEEIPALFRKTIEENKVVPPKEETRKREAEGPQSRLWTLTIEDVIGEHPASNFASPFHDSETGGNTTVSNGLMHCWRHGVSLTPLQALVVKAGLSDCTTAGDGHKGTAVGPSKLDFKDKALVLKVWDYAKANGIVPQDDIHPFGEDKAKKGRRKKEDEEPAKPMTALRFVNGKVYRQVKTDDGKEFFEVYHKDTGEITKTGEIPETNEIPTKDLKGITFPRRHAPYGTPLLLYERLKERINYLSSQSGHKNAVFCLWLMYHGCIPAKHRHNLQIIPMGPAGTGKGRYVEIAKYLGDRARVTTDPTLATAYRLNAMLNGGVDILDEMPEEAEHIEAYVRARYDPHNVQQRILDPHSTTDIAGFEIAGPTLVTRRRAFHDDANTDRGIIIKCEKPIAKVPLEVIEHEPDRELQDQLAMFWSEHYSDQVKMLPTELELMYDPLVDEVDCRLRLAATYLMKLAKLIGPKAEKDLEGFVEEQEVSRKELKATTPEGLAIRAVWDTIMENIDGHKHYTQTKDGQRTQVTDTLSSESKQGKTLIYLTRTEDGHERDEKKTKLIGISWTMIGNKAGLSREEPGALLQPYTVSREWAGGKHSRIRTIGFNIPNLDNAFRTFLPDYDPSWASRLNNGFDEQVTLDQTPPSSPPASPPSAIESTMGERVASEASVALISTSQSSIVQSSKGGGGGRASEASRDIIGYETPVASPGPSAATSVMAAAEIVREEEDLAKILKDLQGKYCVEEYEYQVEIVSWIIKTMLDAKAQGDPVSAFILRGEGRRQYAQYEDFIVRTVDSGFAELEALTTRILALKKAKAKADPRGDRRAD